MTRAHNFCAGPCTLPESVLAELGAEMLEFGDSGMSVVEMSHRSDEYEAIHHETLALLRSLFAVPDDVDVLLLQGGATLQFAMVPLNLLAGGGNGSYVVSGAWGRKAFADAARVGRAHVAWDGASEGYRTMPGADEIAVEADASYLHVTSNETIEGVRHPEFGPLADLGHRLVADMSSDYLSREIDWEPFDVIYGGAQKNLGPAGLAVVFARKSVVEAGPDDLPSYLSYRTHASSDSLANTPPVFSIWAMGKVLRWMEASGGVAAMEWRAAERSGLVYDAIDGSGGYYRNPVDPEYRSHMNVVFRLPDEASEQRFLAEATERRFLNLKGHRSVGGIRASIYNALPTSSVEALVSFMTDFAKRAG
ncbi:MAG: 3-phosphoserine/phosphohydroxythreonine transaminase [Acidimicrobiia bacterium]|nr:3-phosphoserine/phosphohydroxythreonine transaminase [Acidimicrobiia bacterium]